MTMYFLFIEKWWNQKLLQFFDRFSHFSSLGLSVKIWKYLFVGL